jgi:signal peptide peptidase SppA
MAANVVTVDVQGISGLEDLAKRMEQAIGTARRSASVRDCLTDTFLLVHESALDGRADPRVGSVDLSGQVAVVEVMGPLAQRAAADFFGFVDGYDGIEARFAEALAANPDAIVLRIDSPGGDAAGCFEAVKRMRAAAQAAGKPVVAFADEMAASAAYALACVADSGIVAPSSGMVGSVGVIAMHASQSRLLADAGIDVSVFRSGKRKAEGTAVEPLSDDAAAAMQSHVDALAQQFGALVAEARGTTADAVLGYEGAIFTAAEAVKNGLADRIGTLDDAVAMAAKAARARRREKNMQELKAALGLPDNYAGDLVAEVAQIAGDNVRILAALGAKNATDAVGAVEALQAMAEQGVEATKRAAELEAAQAQADVDCAIREGRDTGKLTAATETFWRAKPAAEIREYLKVAPVVIPGAAVEPQPAPVEGAKRWEDISAADKAAMQASDPAQFAALLKDFRARNGRKG